MSDRAPGDVPSDDELDLLRAGMDLAAGGVTAVVNGLLTKVHAPSRCVGEHCWVHDPSDHHMVTWPVRWRDDRRIAERVCEHGVGHPDPDDAAFHRRHGRDVTVHGCDGCCGLRPPGGRIWRIGGQVDALSPDAGGRWLVTTQGSEHIWDLDDMTYARMRGEGRERWKFDGQTHPIVRVDRWPRVDSTFLVYCDDPTDEHIEQSRRSSIVRTIERLEPVEE